MEFYHVLNRGVEKRNIFMDDRDRARFIHDLYEFNSTERADPNFGRTSTSKMMDIGCPSFDERYGDPLVMVHFFCLMPNHYHLMISPLVEHGIPLFMKKLNMGYAKYFNERYQRSGSLFQGKYKSVHLTEDSHFLYLPYYIHLNPLDMHTPSWRDGVLKDPTKALAYLNAYRWSSHLDYLGTKNFPSVTDRSFFAKQFGGTGGYVKSFTKYVRSFSLSELVGTTLE